MANLTILCVTKIVALLSSKIIVLNEAAKNVLIKEFGVTEKKVSVIPHGVKRATSSPVNNLNLKPVILSMGFLRKSKTLECLITAFQNVLVKCPNTVLLVVGGLHAHDNDSASTLTSLKQLISDQKLNEKVILKGFVSEHELDKFISTSDIIVLLSSERFYVESSGTLARVADFERPIICSKVPKFQAELKNGVDCIMVIPNDRNSLSSAISLLIEKEGLRRNIALNLKNRFKKNYWETIAKKHLELYKAVISD
jgi:glycosyltransferase involved in cell wall biosynthesis